jgi:hypothetical protein
MEAHGERSRDRPAARHPVVHEVGAEQWGRRIKMRQGRSFKWIALLGLVSCLAVGYDDDNGTKPGPDKVIVVKPDGSGDYPTIQAAVDAADSAHVIAPRASRRHVAQLQG